MYVFLIGTLQIYTSQTRRAFFSLYYRRTSLHGRQQTRKAPGWQQTQVEVDGGVSSRMGMPPDVGGRAVVEGLVDVVFNRNVNARTEELSTAVQGPPGTGRLVAAGGPGQRYASAMWVKNLRSSRRARCGAPYPDCHPHAANHEPFAIGRAPGAQDRQKGQGTDKQGRHDCGAQCPLPRRRSVRDGPRRAQFQPGHEPVPRRHALAASAGFAAA